MKDLVILPMLAVLLFTSCYPKECTETDGMYLFELPVTLTPALDTFLIGDTISVCSEFDDMVFDRVFQEDFHLKNFKFYPLTYVEKIDSEIYSNRIDDYFEIIIENDFNYELIQYSSGNQALSGEYNLEENIYKLKYKLIPTKEGLYFFQQGSSLYPDGEFQEFEGRCKNKINDAFVMLNNNEDNNVDYLLESPNEEYHIIWEKKDKKFYNFGGYCFYVVE